MANDDSLKKYLSKGKIYSHANKEKDVPYALHERTSAHEAEGRSGQRITFLFVVILTIGCL
jgi:hypothetical protein